MNLKERLATFRDFLKKDTWQSWLVSLILIIIGIKYILFPLLAAVTGTTLPLVVVESCSMYHSSSFNDWWSDNGAKFVPYNISKTQFQAFSLINGLNKGDIVFVLGRKEYKKGEVIIFTATTPYPVIHRILSLEPYETQGDNNPSQLAFETNITQRQIVGKAVARIPAIGWLKLIFFEPSKKPEQRGLCT